MKFTLLLVSLAFSAGAALAQVPQGLSAADPSQQLRSMGMDPTQPGYVLGAPVATDEPAQPLITVIEERHRETRAQARARIRAEQRARARRRVEKVDRVRIIDER